MSHVFASRSLACGILSLTLLSGVSARALTLEEALARAEQNRPELASIAKQLLAGEGRLLQAAVRPGPELEMETENLFDDTSIGVSYLHERGGKREARVETARADLELSGAQTLALRLEIGYEVRKSYLAVIAAEKVLELAQESLSLATSFANTVAEKVRAGAASPIEQARAAVRLHGVSAEAERARRDVAIARAELALAVRDPGVRSESLKGQLPDDLAIPDYRVLASEIGGSSDLKILSSEVLLRRAALSEERAQSTPDITVRSAVNYSRVDEESSITLGISIPLFASKRNRGAQAAATTDVERAELELEAAGQRIAAELERAVAGLQATAREASVLRSEVLNNAEKTLATVQEGYRLGRFPYLDVLDASEVLLSARLQYYEALAALALARIDVDKLLGRTGIPSANVNR
jgi:cobalt-zinc-cadmium efflux system outer membrane protein